MPRYGLSKRSRNFPVLRFEYKAPGMDSLIAGVERWGEEIEQLLVDVIEEAVLYGEERMIEILESSVTKTGLERAARGGHPGRIDTGNMLDDIGVDFRETKGAREGEWGWIFGLEDYYLYQEYGAGNIPAMSALQQSYIGARELMLKRLRDAGFRG